MTGKELYEYLKNENLEDDEIIIRLNINDAFVDFEIKDEKCIYSNAYKNAVIEPKFW